MGHYGTMRRDDAQLATMWMNLTNIVLSKRIQRQKGICNMILFYKYKNIRNQSILLEAGDLGADYNWFCL